MRVLSMLVIGIMLVTVNTLFWNGIIFPEAVMVFINAYISIYAGLWISLLSFSSVYCWNDWRIAPYYLGRTTAVMLFFLGSRIVAHYCCDTYLQILFVEIICTMSCTLGAYLINKATV